MGLEDLGLASGHSSCEVVICGRSRIGWHGGAGVFPHFRPDQTRRREGGLAREPKLCTCRYGNLLTSALELSLTGRRISTYSVEKLDVRIIFRVCSFWSYAVERLNLGF